MFGFARQLLENGQTEDAKAQLRAVLAVEPGYPFARRLLARLGGSPRGSP